MPWLNENGGVAGNPTVAMLLLQIDALSKQCTLHLSRVIAHHNRCGITTYGAAEHCHVDTGEHGPDGDPTDRPVAYANLVSVVARLSNVRIELQTCSTEMSHGGMP
jgi:hypothetical protein